MNMQHPYQSEVSDKHNNMKISPIIMIYFADKGS